MLPGRCYSGPVWVLAFYDSVIRDRLPSDLNRQRDIFYLRFTISFGLLFINHEQHIYLFSWPRRQSHSDVCLVIWCLGPFISLVNHFSKFIRSFIRVLSIKTLIICGLWCLTNNNGSSFPKFKLRVCLQSGCGWV